MKEHHNTSHSLWDSISVTFNMNSLLPVSIVITDLINWSIKSSNYQTLVYS